MKKMDVRIKVMEVLSILDSLKGVINGVSIPRYEGYIRLKISKDNGHIYSYNDNLYMKIKVHPQEVNERLDVCIRYVDLYWIANTCKSEEIEITKENKMLIVVGENVHYAIPCVTTKKYLYKPKVTFSKAPGIIVKKEELKALINKTLPFMDKKDMAYQGVSFDIEKNSIKGVAYNKFRLSMYEIYALNNLKGNISVTVNGSHLKSMLRLLNNKKYKKLLCCLRIDKSNQYMKFTIGDGEAEMIVSLLQNVQGINYNGIFGGIDNCIAKVNVSPKWLLNTIKSIPFNARKKETVRLTISANKVLVSNGKHLENTAKFIDVKTEGMDKDVLSAVYKPKYLVDILKKLSKEEEITLYFDTKTQRCFINIEKENLKDMFSRRSIFKHCILPVKRLENENFKKIEKTA